MEFLKPIVLGVMACTLLVGWSPYLTLGPKYPSTGQQLVSSGLHLAAAGLGAHMGVEPPILNLVPEPLPVVAPWALRLMAGVPALVAAGAGVRNAT